MTDQELKMLVKGLEHCKAHGRLGGKGCNGHWERSSDGQEIVRVDDYRKSCPYGTCVSGCVVALTDDALRAIKGEPKEIGYQDKTDVLLKMWMDEEMTDGEYYRISDRLAYKMKIEGAGE